MYSEIALKDEYLFYHGIHLLSEKWEKIIASYIKYFE